MSTALLDAKAADGTVAGGKFLTFFLDEEEYGLVILTVQEIMGHSAEQLTIESELFGSLTVPQDQIFEFTDGLQGPITLNVRTRLGRQVVVADCVYGIRWTLDFRITRMAS